MMHGYGSMWGMSPVWWIIPVLLQVVVVLALRRRRP
jgi:uncharacterized membrane protein